ncbi:RNA-directed DNA polymerase from mobile element jockey [Trichonephila inaurata madagascariensis]|uniref:RNA-directed DNA polymerase from mobile element jockey n=1 Tax=Trichonephila inaurata madagascariensis TaxID=2747483 RepID=A0A8X6Y1R0_9ARAC|nr:RNA-directed DNA polymerase from mobile element jockey [Trichonephila inaurata madagascariensis]
MIKRSTPHHQIVINNNSFETTAIKLIRQNDQPVTIVSAYRPPRKPITVQDLHQIFRNQGYVLVASDLNAKHASWSPLTLQNTSGNIIRRFCDSTEYSLNAPPEPTCFHRNCRSTSIDIAICKGMTITDCSFIPELSSDHTTLSSLRDKIKAKNRIRKAWQITKNPLLKTQLNKMQKDIKKDLNNHTNNKWNELLTVASPDDDSLYTLVKSISKNKTFHVPPIVGPMGLHYSTEDKIDLFADSLESSFQENPEPYDNDLSDHVEERVDNFLS